MREENVEWAAVVRDSTADRTGGGQDREERGGMYCGILLLWKPFGDVQTVELAFELSAMQER